MFAGGFRLIFAEPGKTRAESTLSPFSVRSVKGSALPSRSLALLCAVSRRCLASFSSGKAPTWMSQPLRFLGGLGRRSGCRCVIAENCDFRRRPRLRDLWRGGRPHSSGDSLHCRCVSLRTVVTEGFGEDGQVAAAGGGAAATGGLGGAAAKGAAGEGAVGGSLLTVERVVTLVGLETTGGGTSRRLSDGSGVSEAVYIVAGWTVTVLTDVGFIGSVDPGAGPPGTDGATEATRTLADPVRSSSLASLLSLRSCAVSTPSTTGGAVRLIEAMLMLFSIRLNARVAGVGGTTAEHDRNEVAIGAPD